MDSANFNPSFATAVETADAMRRKRISASELLDMTFQRIDRHNPTLNAIVWENREEAVARAKHAVDGQRLKILKHAKTRLIEPKTSWIMRLTI
jgi:Asp-tRNA(Asn)/Glu-tRNA(Gln) amidotransferase A subunit family amidase